MTKFGRVSRKAWRFANRRNKAEFNGRPEERKSGWETDEETGERVFTRYHALHEPLRETREIWSLRHALLFRYFARLATNFQPRITYL